MSKLFVALENISRAKSNSSLEEVLLHQEQELKELGAAIEGISELNSALAILSLIEKSSTDDRTMNAVKEHILDQVGYQKSYSLESFANDAGQVLNIAQEGFFSRIGNAFKRAFTSSKEFERRLDEALERLKTRGTSGQIIVDPSWSKHLIANSSKLVTAKDVMQYLTQVKGIIDVKELNKYLDRVATIYQDIAQELSNNDVVSDKETVKNINRIYEDSRGTIAEFQKLAKKNARPYHRDEYPNYEPIEYRDAVKFEDYLKKEFSGKLYDSAEYRRFESASARLNQIMTERRQRSIKFLVLGWDPQDVRAAVSIIRQLNDAIHSIIEIIFYRHKVAWATMRYIEDSAA